MDRTTSRSSGRTSTRASSTTGWDALRERTFERQKELGWIPADAKLTPRAESMASWDSIPESERAFQRRLMEMFAGFLEHVDVQAGRVIDELDRLGVRDDTIVLYICGDNGASAEGQRGTVSELLAQNNIPNTMEQQLAALNELGGLDALGGPKADNMYHAGWAWAGNTPFHHTKLVASHFGGTRNPLAISWPARIQPDRTPRSQFHHVNDVVPTLYELLGITPPEVVEGFAQDPIDGVSMVYTFADAQGAGPEAHPVLREQRQSRHLPRRLVRGDFRPAGPVGHRGVGGEAEELERERRRVGALRPAQRLLAGRGPGAPGAGAPQQMKALFLDEAKANGAFPIGAGNWLRTPPRGSGQVALHELAVRRDHDAHAGVHRAGPRPREQPGHDRRRARRERFGRAVRAGRRLGALSLYLDQGDLVYEYNMMIIERYIARSKAKIGRGGGEIEVDTAIAKPGGPAEVVLAVDGAEVARTTVARTVPAAFTASETFDVGVDLGSPVSLATSTGDRSRSPGGSRRSRSP